MALAVCLATSAPAQVFLSGGTYSQNFDTLAASGTGNAWVNNTTLPGWYADRGTNGPLNTYNAGTGSSTTGSLYSFGSATASSDRALGSLASNTTSNLTYGVRLHNDTLNSLQDFTVSYTGEQWRNNNNANAQTLQFSYQTSGSAITSADALNAPGSGGWIAFNTLDFTSPVHTTVSAALDGNASANRTVFSGAVLTGVVLNPGDELFLRWFDPNDSGNDHGLGIDDLSVSFTVTPVPEPREFAAVAALGLLGFAAYRRRSSSRA